MLDDKVAELSLALLGEVTPCAPDIREVRIATLLGDSVRQKETVLTPVLVERRVRVPKSIPCS